jgi:hypothetical protein
MTMPSPPRSPRRLGHAGHLALVGELTKTDATQHESAKDRSLSAASLAPRIPPDAEFLSGPLLLFDQRLLCHSQILFRPYPIR